MKSRIIAALFLLGSLFACNTPPAKPTIALTAPPHGSQFREGENVLVQSMANDATGISRVELLVDGTVVRSDAPLTVNPQAFPIAQYWQAVAGNHTLGVRAYNSAGLGSDLVVVSISVASTSAAIPTAPPPPAATTVPPTVLPPTAVAVCSDNYSWVADVTVSPGTIFSSNETFTKVWRVRNDGTCVWDSRYQFVFVGGKAMTTNATAIVPFTTPGATIEIHVAMTAPESAGTHTGQWQMRGPNGLFGAPLAVSINVTAQVQLPPGCPGAPIIDFFNASPSTINAGQSTTLLWGKVDYATKAEIDQGIGGVATPGTRTVSPATTTTYTMSATGCGGTTSKQATVTVSGSAAPPAQPPPAQPPPPQASLTFSFSPKSGQAGSEVNLFLSTSTAVSVYYNGQILPKKVSADGKTLTITIPGNAVSGYFEIKWDSQSVKATEPFTVTPSAQGDLILEDVFLATTNEVILRVARTGNLSGNFKYQVIALTTNVVVASATVAMPAGSQAFWTGYKPGGTLAVKAIIDPGNEIAETNEGNNQMTKTCNTTSHTCQ